MKFFCIACRTMPLSYKKSKDIKKCAKSIDELESITGIDFYHNLPDDIEANIEKNYKESDWTW